MAKIYRDIDDPIELEVLKQNAQLGNVPNVTTNNQTPTWSMATTLANIVSGETLTKIMGKISKAINDIISHIGNKSNPHGVTKSQVGLGNVGNYKAVSTVASQGLTTTEKSNARANIGAGTSNFSGSYNDLTNKPTIPTVNNATLTIQKNGTDVGTFTANASANKDINITVPTKTSELTNDSGYKTTDNNTTYTLTKSGSTISLTGSDGSKTSVTDSNTTYDVATSSSLGLVKSGTDITVDSSGNVNVVGGDVNTAQTLKTARTINGVSFNGSENITITANPKENQLTNQNLNDIRTSGEYYAGGSNSVTNKPSGIDAFSLQVVRSAGGYYTQILIGGNNRPNKMFIRTYQSGTWTSWYPFYSSEYPQTSVSGNAGTATKLQTARKIAGVSFDGTKDITISYNNLTDKPTIPSGVQVIDNLTSSSTTASLSANQGRVLKSYLDKKIVVSSTQPSGQQTGDTWYQII